MSVDIGLSIANSSFGGATDDAKYIANDLGGVTGVVDNCPEDP